MLRMIFEKTEHGIWISHLDLMRVFQRAFRRAGLSLRHTQGYNPHAFVSILLPLSVGAASVCEVLEFELNEPCDLAQLPSLLNRALPQGIHCLHAYEDGQKPRDLTFLRAQVTLEYDKGVSPDARDAVAQLFQRESLVVIKRSKKGDTELDIRPMVKDLQITQPDPHTLVLVAVVCAQNPSLNPALLASAVIRYLPEHTPDFSHVMRLALYDGKMRPYR